MRKWTILMMLTLGTASLGASAPEQPRPLLPGVWHVTVAVRNCETGDTIREVRALNAFRRDGTVSETASNMLRGPSLGTWRHVRGNTYTSVFEFFRFNPDGSFASTARVSRTIDVAGGGAQFTSLGTVEDFDGHGVRVSVGCAAEVASRAQ